MKSLNKYKAFIFDIDDTLYDYKSCNEAGYSSVAKWISKHYKCSLEIAKEAIKIGREESKLCSTQNNFIEYTAAYHNRILYFQKVAEHYNSKEVIKDTLKMYYIYNKTFFKKMKSFYWVKNFFKYSYSKIGICTNMVSEVQFNKLKKLGILKYVNFIVTSEETGVEKPNPYIYQVAIDKSKESPDDILFVGDDYENDVKVPQKAGMDALLINDFLKEVNNEYSNRKSK